MNVRPALGWLIAPPLLVACLSASAAPPSIAGCRVFPSNNAWNMRVDGLQVHPQSAAWVSTIGSSTKLHPDFGPPAIDGPIGIPFVSVPGSQPFVPIVFDVDDESDPGPYPIPPDAPIEGGSDSSGDRHVLVVDAGNCHLYETDASYPQLDGSWQAYSGAVFDLGSNALRPDTWTSADAAGLPILLGLVRYSEVAAGEMNHAVRFTASATAKSHIWPARHDASSNTGTQFPPMGARFRLKAGVDISGFPQTDQVILKALKKYGMILADNGSSWYISGDSDNGWDDTILHALTTLHGSDFEAVDTTPMMVSVDSGESFRTPPPVSLRLVASGLASPTEIANAGDGSDRLFLVEKGGTIRILNNGGILATPFLSIASLVSTSSERGLLGLAFDPKFKTNRRFFVYYSRASDGAEQLSSFLVSAGDPNVADAASESPILTIPHPGFDNHNGGKLAFGPDGYLYIGVGDGGSGNDPPNNAQTLSVLLGKLLRIDVSGASGYTVPASNPFVGVGGTLPEIWAYGLRNPWRFSFDRRAGDLYIGDVGQGATEEVDFQPAGIAGGRNYGWRVFEGTGCNIPATGCSLPNHTPPVLQYHHDASGGIAITGGYVYRGRKSSALDGFYVYGDYGSNRIWAAVRSASGSAWGNFVIVEPPGVLNGISTFGEDEAGNLYVASINDGNIYAIDAPGPAAPGQGSQFDFDSNGKSDLLWANADGRAAIWLMNGIAPSATAEIIGAGTGWSVAQVADFNADGKSDLVWQHTDGRIAIYLMNGTTPSATQQILNAGGGWSVTHTPDLNGDGKADLLFQNTDGSVAVWTMNGTTMTGGTTLLGPGTGWSVTRTADFDGDGMDDILWTHTDGRVAIWLMNGTSVKSTGQILNAGTGWSVSHTADLDGDGKADIVWQHTDGSIAVWLMNGTAMASGSGILGAGTGWSVTRTADFDGDGRADLFFQHTDGRAAIWLMNGLTATTQTQILNAGGGWSAQRTVDLNGDGKADIVWQNTDGSVAVWLMNGTTMTSGSGILGTGTGWSVSAVNP